MNPQDVTNKPRDLRKAWESQSHLQSLPPWEPSLAWKVTGWLFVCSMAAAFGSCWATWGGVLR